MLSAVFFSDWDGFRVKVRTQTKKRDVTSHLGANNKKFHINKFTQHTNINRPGWPLGA